MLLALVQAAEDGAAYQFGYAIGRIVGIALIVLLVVLLVRSLGNRKSRSGDGPPEA